MKSIKAKKELTPEELKKTFDEIRIAILRKAAERTGKSPQEFIIWQENTGYFLDDNDKLATMTRKKP